ncbi:MAG: hypothetical protein HFJ45_03640 [Clostridia bacterium]|nr:hypothetical protein [Clostridia bacterium]
MESGIRMIMVGSIITLGFISVIAKLSYVIFVKGIDYKQAAYAQQTKSQIIGSNRGTIYDVNRRGFGNKCFSRYCFI